VKEKRTLGRTGFQVSEIGYGGWPIGNNGVYEYGDIDEQEAKAVVRAYLEAGGNFIDTARGYGERSERIIGTAVREYGHRDAVCIATKSAEGRTLESIPGLRTDLEQSLSLLKTDYVDVFQLHQPPEDPEVMQRALDAMETLRQEGKIRAIGASIKGPDVTEKTVDLCYQYMDTGRLDAIQLVYSVLRQRMRAVIAEAGKRNIGIIVRTALESGLLTGKYKPGHRFTGIDQRTRYKPEHLEFILRTAERLEKEAVHEPYENLAQVAIRFALIPEGVSTVIVGAHKLRHIQANVDTESLPPLRREVVELLQAEYGGITASCNYQ
jgi:aryl-alcohol dehydrogenase-like predicted oxidoreductase